MCFLFCLLRLVYCCELYALCNFINMHNYGCRSICAYKDPLDVTQEKWHCHRREVKLLICCYASCPVQHPCHVTRCPTWTVKTRQISQKPMASWRRKGTPEAVSGYTRRERMRTLCCLTPRSTTKTFVGTDGGRSFWIWWRYALSAVCKYDILFISGSCA